MKLHKKECRNYCFSLDTALKRVYTNLIRFIVVRHKGGIVLTPSKTVGSLTIFDNGTNGLSWERTYMDDLGQEHKDYHGISGEDMLTYPLADLLPQNFSKDFTEEEQLLFLVELHRIKQKADYNRD